MIKVIPLGDDRQIEAHYDLVDRRYVLHSIALQRGKLPLGRAYFEGDEIEIADLPFWRFLPGEEERAAEYYNDRYPDLAEGDAEALLREGFRRELRELTPVIERARELEAVINRDDRGPWVAVDVDGRIRAIGDTAFEAVDDAEYAGWEGWYSPTAASEDSLWIIPANKVRVEL
jgi:hypothetical protein